MQGNALDPELVNLFLPLVDTIPYPAINPPAG
jgi:hypothetical protein